MSDCQTWYTFFFGSFWRCVGTLMLLAYIATLVQAIVASKTEDKS